MFQLSLEKAAKELLDSHFEENPRPDYLRLYVRPRNTNRASRLALKPDAKGERDMVLDEGGYRFVLSRHLAEQIGRWAKIEANEDGGFDISSEKSFSE